MDKGEVQIRGAGQTVASGCIVLIVFSDVRMEPQFQHSYRHHVTTQPAVPHRTTYRPEATRLALLVFPLSLVICYGLPSVRQSDPFPVSVHKDFVSSILRATHRLQRRIEPSRVRQPVAAGREVEF